MFFSALLAFSIFYLYLCGMEQVKLSSDYCPTCGAECDAATPADGSPATPKPNDISLCFYCGETLTFNEDLKLEVLPYDELLLLGDETVNEVLHVKRFIQEEIKRKQREKKNETNTTKPTTNGEDILHE